MKYVLALDQGTSSSRAIVFDADGKAVASGQREFAQRYPQPGWVEHDANEILSSQLDAAREAIAKVDVDGIAAIGIANQRETTIVWDRRTGQPIHNAIVWQDTRTGQDCKRLQDEGHESLIRQKTGLLPSPYFSATKIAWILDNVPGARGRAEAGELAFGTVDCWLIWKLTGGASHVTDPTNAARTLLYDIVAGEWSEDLLRLFRIPASMLPKVVASSGKVAEVTGFAPLNGVPIAGIAGDQQAALFGQLCLTRGDIKTTYGTGCFLLQHIGGEFMLSGQRLITTLACSLDGKPAYALEGSVFIGGAVVQWLRDNLGFIADSGGIRQLAASVPDSGGVVLVPAFVGLGAPHWDSEATGLIIGLRRETGKGEIARAAVESIAFQVADVIDAVAQDSGVALHEMRVDGGAARDDDLLQFQADLLGIQVARPVVAETTALGAAYLAGLAIGFWPNVEALKAHHRQDVVFHPRMAREDAATRRAQWSKAVERAKGWSA